MYKEQQWKCKNKTYVVFPIFKLKLFLFCYYYYKRKNSLGDLKYGSDGRCIVVERLLV